MLCGGAVLTGLCDRCLQAEARLQPADESAGGFLMPEQYLCP